MTISASLLRTAYKLSGAKKSFALPEKELRAVIEKQNRSRGVFTPTDRKAYYETITVNGFPFAIHDLMGKNRYGDMEVFCQKLKEMGYAEVRMIDTTNGMFMTKKEAGHLMLQGSTLLVGRK